MVSFNNFSRIASLCVGFHLGTLHGYIFDEDFWPNLNFLLEHKIKHVLICFKVKKHLMKRGSLTFFLYKNEKDIAGT